MKTLIALVVAALGMVALAEDKSQPQTLTFYVTGMECGSCMAMITQSINEVKSVKDVSLDIINGYANVTFDPRVASAHQIAQAVFNTMPVHGKPFVPSMKIRVPDYAKTGNAAKVDEVLAKHPEWVEVELANKEKGEFVLYYNPLKVDATKDGPQGWSPELLAHAIQDPAPKGLGLAFELKKEEPYVPVKR